MNQTSDTTCKKVTLGNSRRGFSIIEAVLAMFILSTGLVSIIALTRGNISQTLDSRDALIASGLSQEGIELVRSIRDNSAALQYKDSDPELFIDFKSGTRYNTVTVCTDYKWVDSGIKLRPCPATGLPLGTTGGAGFYSHDAGVSNNFRRVIWLDEFEPDNLDPDSVKVRSMVTWNNTPIPPSVSDCRKGNSCVYDELILTSWVIHRD